MNQNVYIIGEEGTQDCYYFDDERFARWFQIRREVWPMKQGSSAIDGGNFFMTESERDEVLKKEPGLERFIRRTMGSDEFINNKIRYCFWLVEASPADIKHSRILYERVQKVKEFRLSCRREATKKLADRPALFADIRQPATEYMLIPRVSSENRKYIPMGYVSPDVIVTDSAFALPNAAPYHFGILTSGVHMSWMRVVCGRLKSDYRYSGNIVYNNFVWPKPNPNQVMKIESTALEILKVREKYSDCSFADLYDEVTMPDDLRKAHNDNDDAVMEVYGFNKNFSELDIVSKLMDMLEELTAKTDGQKKKR